MLIYDRPELAFILRYHEDSGLTLDRLKDVLAASKTRTLGTELVERTIETPLAGTQC